MTTRELSKRILIIALPASVQFIVNHLQLTTDMAFIGHYSADGLSAIQNVRVSYFVLLSFFLAFTNGTNILIAQHLGARQHQQASRIAETSLFYNQLLSFAYLLFWFFGGRMFLGLFGATGTVLDISADYVKALSLMFVAEGLILTTNVIFQGRGKTLPITYGALIRAGLNVPLDYCLIFGKWGFPEMGATGAAVGTVISELVGGAFLLFMLFRDREFPVTFAGIFRPATDLFRKVMQLGVPTGLESMVWALGNTGLLALLNRLDPLAAGYFGITHVLKIFNLSIYFGLGVATIALVGRAIGAKDYVLAKKSGLLTLKFSFVVCLVMGLLYWLFPAAIIGLFLDDPAAIAQIAPLLLIVALTLFPQAVNVVGGNSLRARGDAPWLLKIQLIGSVVIVVLAYIAMFVLQRGLVGLLWVVFFDEFWRAIVNFLRLRTLFRREQKLMAYTFLKPEPPLDLAFQVEQS